MNWRPLLILSLGLVPLLAQPAEPVFFTWHAFEYVAYENASRELTLQLHFRTRHEFRKFALLRGAVYGTQRLPKGWLWTSGYLRQTQESFGDTEWVRQQRIYSSLSRPIRQWRLQHIPRVQYDYLFDMPGPSYSRGRFNWHTEWTGRVRPYVSAEVFAEKAGVQRFRPRVGVRFQPAKLVEADIVYQYDRIYLRGLTNRHIVQTTLTFHRPGKD